MNTEDTRDTERPTVLAAPDYRESNPYQSRLAAALASRGVSTRTTDGSGRIAPLSRALVDAGRPPVLHLHFVAPYTAAGTKHVGAFDVGRLLSVVLALRFLFDLTLAALLTDRVVWTAHDLRDHQRRADRTEIAVKHLFVRFLCDTVVVHCDRARDLLVETLRLPATTRGKMRTIPHGHFLDDYPDETRCAEARTALGLPADATVVVFFGWIRRYKNVPALIDTFARLDRRDVRLVVAGNPQDETVARDVRAAAARDDRVSTVLEFVPATEVQVYLRAADVVALPFRTEQQTLLTSGSVRLAMGFGRAVVAPRLGCVGDVLTADGPDGEATGTESAAERTAPAGGSGPVRVVAGGVVYESTAQLETALRTALNADLDRMGRRNRAHIETLGWGDIAARTADVYTGSDGSP